MAEDPLFEYFVVGGELLIPQAILLRELLAPGPGRRGIWAGAIRGGANEDGRVRVTFEVTRAGRLTLPPKELFEALMRLAPGMITGRIVCRSVFSSHRVVAYFDLTLSSDGTISESGPH